MQTSIAVTNLPIIQSQKDALLALFDTPAYATLKQIISARCITAQVEAMNAQLFEHQTEAAKDHAEVAKNNAIRFNATLDVLDELQGNPDSWDQVQLEPRR